MQSVEVEFSGRLFSMETGRFAKQADGSILIRYGDTMLIVTACVSDEPKTDYNFFPLTVDYREKAYAAGKIPGGFFKREGRPQTREIISARITDRSIRPLFPDDFRYEVQVDIGVISFDQENDADILGITGASAALLVAGIPFEGPIGGVRIGKIGDNYILNPTLSEKEESELELVIAGNGTDIIMVEGEAREVSEETILGALKFAMPYLKELVNIQEELVKKTKARQMKYEPVEVPKELYKAVEKKAEKDIEKCLKIRSKIERGASLKQIVNDVIEKLAEDFPESEQQISDIVYEIEGILMREHIFKNNERIDGRKFNEIRDISCEIGLLPRTHGSALFTRGETQSLSVVTLGTKLDEKRIEDLEGESWKSFMLHYNFPAFSVGEIKPNRGPGRREIGHGVLAERALQGILPKEDVFPYTIRIVSDILESNGSSSMATVCAGSLALMDAAVPIKTAVAGLALGLIKGEKEVVILSDIMGEEDHHGDMDFKVAGTKDGITAFQMDIKITGLDFDIMEKALYQAQEGRMKILDIMNSAIQKPRDDISMYAPRIQTMKINPEKIGGLIGTGGKVIRAIQEDSNSNIAIEDDGTLTVSAKTKEDLNKAIQLIKDATEEPELNKVYSGVVKTITNFGAFVEILPGYEGLLHISEIEHKRTTSVESVLKVGQQVDVKVIGMDDNGKIRLSRKALLKKDQ
ncbi:polyribonucleotide nucleotidyltransferase [bacterium]|nr:polyribonucleotide nucleotidyltransferase [bacterium]